MIVKNARRKFLLRRVRSILDLNEIKPKNIADSILTKRTEKTGDTLTIPLNDHGIEIIDRHTNKDIIQLLPFMSNQKMT